MIASFFLFIYLFILSIFPVKTLVIGLSGQPLTLNPSKIQTDTEKTISNILFRRLLKYNPNTGDYEYDLLKSYKELEPGLVYEVTLKKNQYWQDGKEITSDDIIHTASLSKNLKEVSSDKVDKYTVRFFLPSKYSPFISLLDLYLVPSHKSDKFKDLWPVNSSKYRIIRYKKDRAFIKELVVMNSQGSFPFRKIVFKFYNNDDDLQKGLLLREIDTALLKSPFKVEGYSFQKIPFFGRSYLLIFNTKKDYLDTDTRLIISSYLDLNKIFKEQLYFDAQKSLGPFSGTWAQAEKSLLTFTAPNKKLNINKTLKLYFPSTTEAKKLAKEIRTQLEERGLSIELNPSPQKNFEKFVRSKDYDLILTAHEYGLDPDRFVFWHSSQSDIGLNFSNFSNVRIDKSLEDARSEVDLQKRKEHYRVFQSAFFEELPAFYLLHPTLYLHFRQNIKIPVNKKYYYPWQILDYLDLWKINKPQTIF